VPLGAERGDDVENDPRLRLALLGADARIPRGGAAGAAASPQTLQYPASRVPPQRGFMHATAAVVMAAALPR
jgi:hypothetical protein